MTNFLYLLFWWLIFSYIEIIEILFGDQFFSMQVIIGQSHFHLVAIPNWSTCLTPLTTSITWHIALLELSKVDRIKLHWYQASIGMWMSKALSHFNLNCSWAKEKKHEGFCFDTTLRKKDSSILQVQSLKQFCECM